MMELELERERFRWNLWIAHRAGSDLAVPCPWSAAKKPVGARRGVRDPLSRWIRPANHRQRGVAMRAGHHARKEAEERRLRP